jgi:capsular exopolysaccharide synthesis family protein
VVNVETLAELRTQLASMNVRLDDATAARKANQRRLEENRQLRSVLQIAAPPIQAPVSTQVQSPPTAPSPMEQKLSDKRAELAAASTRYTPLHPEVRRLTLELERLEALAEESRQQPQRPDPVVPNAPVSAPAFPSVVESTTDLLGPEIQVDITRLDAEIARTEQARRSLTRRIALYEARLNPAPAIAQELATLDRDYEAAKQRYNIFADKKLSSELAARVDASDENQMFRVIDAASLPQFPINANRRLLAMAGCMAGILMGLGLGFLREFLDPSLQTEEDAAAELQLPVLISIPVVATGRKKNRKKIPPPKQGLAVVPRKDELLDARAGGMFHLDSADTNVRSIVLDSATIAGEQYRLMSARLSVLQNQRKVKSLLISSAIPNDGKTFMACSLAGVLAREPGKKVLLIDADLRTGSAGKTLGLSRESLGLSELLRNSLTTSDRDTDSSGEAHPNTPILKRTLWKCTDVNLYFLPSGGTVDSPADLLGSRELERLLRYAETLFDWVIIDSPPVLGLADTNLLVPVCGSALLVVNSGKTPAAAAKEAIHRIGSERLSGIVMNRVRTINSVKYYGKYYGKYYQGTRSLDKINSTR